jgi:hypothetical protein
MTAEDKRTGQRQAFAAALEAHYLKRFRLDVVAVDLGDSWEVLRTDGQELTPLEARAFHIFRAGYRTFGADV